MSMTMPVRDPVDSAPSASSAAEPSQMRLRWR